MFSRNVAQFSSQSSSQLTMTHHILIIDSQVDDYQQLVAGAKPGFDVFVLDAHHDGIEQVTQILNSLHLRPHASLSLHIVSHGSPGTLYLGNSQLSLGTLERYTKQIKTWFTPYSSLLTPHSLYLYGCNVAAGDAGEEFLAKLYSLTKVKLAASTTPIGNQAFGGNWHFDVTTHSQLTEIAFNAETTANYSYAFVALPNISTLFQFNGTATQTSSSEARLTSAASSQSGSAFSNARIDFTYNWNFTFQLYLGTSDSGADGIGFVLHNDPNGASAIGSTGEGLGIAGVRNSVGIEFDTYQNTGELTADHTSFLDPENGNAITAPVGFASNIEDGNYHNVVVSWNASTQTLSYTFDGVSMGSINRNVVAVDFGGSNLIYWGFGAATGGSVNEHRFRLVDFNGRLVDQSGNNIINTNVAPAFTSNANPSINENSTLAVTVAATDGDGDPLTYSITGGADASRFTLNSSTRQLSFINPPNFENALDSNGDNVYQVQVTASDGRGGTTVQTINVTVNNINDAPTGTLSITGTPVENGTLTANTSTIADGDGLPNSSTFTYQWQQFNGTTWININGATSSSFTPGDAQAGQNVRVQMSYTDSKGTTETVTSAGVVVANVNDVPTGTLTISGTLQEDSTLTADTSTISDNDGLPNSNTFTYQWQQFNGSNWINISGANSKNFTPGDAQAGQDIRVQMSYIDLQGTTETVTSAGVTITNINDVPTVSAAVTATATEDDIAFSVNLLAGASDADGDALNVTNLTLTGGDASGVTINGNSLNVNSNAYNALAAGESETITYSYNISDSNEGGTVAQTATITINGVNDAPTVTSSDTASIDENTATVMTVTVTDVDGDPITYSITGGTDAALFSIDSSTGELSFKNEPNFESPSDSNDDNIYEVQVTANDGNGGTTAQTINATVTNINDAPVIASSFKVAIVSETTSGNTVGFEAALAQLNDDTYFNFDAALVSFADVDTVAELNQYDAVIISNNGYGQIMDATFATALRAWVEAGGGLVSSGWIVFGAQNNPDIDAVVPVNTVAGYSFYSGAPLQPNGTVHPVTEGVSSFTVSSYTEFPSGGIDAGATVLATTYSSPTVVIGQPGLGRSVYLGPIYSGASFYDTTDLRSGEADQLLEQAVAWAAREASGDPIRETATEDDTLPTVNLLAGASDEDGDVLNVTNLTLTDGDDAGVTINGNSLDIDPNVYNSLAEGESEVITYSYTISDGKGGTVAQTATITINGVNDIPIFTSSNSANVDENTTAIATVTVTDVDGDPITYSISGGADSDKFSIDSTTGELTFINAPDAENPDDADGDNVYEVIVLADDGGEGGEGATQTIQVTVNNVNDSSPVFTSGAAPSVDENTTTITTVVATDADGDPITYSISGGADSDKFSIDSTTGELTFINAPDTENPDDADGDNVYEVIVLADDGGEGSTQTIQVTVNNVSDTPPVFTSDANPSVDENSTAVTTVAATDADGDPITYSISGGADSAKFFINSTTGELSFINAPDAESPGDADGDNVYDVVVLADDGGEGTTQSLQVTVTSVNDNPPVFTSNATATMAENSTVATTVIATDADGDSITYAIAGGVDAALFEIDETTGELSFITAPNFEMPTDNNGVNSDNVYEVTVSASDGSEATTQNLSISVVDLSNGVTDFNNDNLPDVVWRRPSTGQTNIWFTDGKIKIGGGPAGATIENPNWLTVGVGDFDKDGKRDDILWRNVATGANTIWFMDGINKVGNATLDSIGTNWEVQGVGDFEHQDYTDDILWRNQTTGQTLVWTMNGASKTGTINFGTLGTAWKAQGVGDFEANNFVDDIVWRNYATGQTLVWTTDGQQKTGSFALDTVGVNWKIDGVGDLDGDGTVDDLLWYNTSNNSVSTWFIDNGAKYATSTVGAPSDGWDAVL